MVRGFKFWIKEAEGSYFLCSTNIGADQLRIYRIPYWHPFLQKKTNRFFQDVAHTRYHPDNQNNIMERHAFT